VKWVRSVLVLGLLGFLVYAVYAWLNQPGTEPQPKEAEVQQAAVESVAPPQIDLGSLQPPAGAGAGSANQLPPLPGQDGSGTPPLPVPEQSDQQGNSAPPLQTPPAAASAGKTEQAGQTDDQNAPGDAPDGVSQHHHDPGVIPAQVQQGVTAPGTDSHDSGSGFDQAMQEAEKLLQSNQLAEALLVLSRWYGHPKLSEQQHRQLVGLLDQLAGTVVYSRQHWLEPAHVVKPGETLQQIAQQYQVPWQLLAKINGILPPYTLQPGETLKVVRGPFHAEVDLGRMQLTLFVAGGRYAGRFPIGLGQEIPPVPGEFGVVNKVVHPQYVPADPNQQPIEGGSPQNPLGQRLIQLEQNLAIHGTNDPSRIGRSAQVGCIALRPKDMADVFDILSVGSKVVIRR